MGRTWTPGGAAVTPTADLAAARAYVTARCPEDAEQIIEALGLDTDAATWNAPLPEAIT